MHWSFGHFTFNADRGIVLNGNQEVLLEPKASALLAYFCKNYQRDISREELIEHVWHGQIVSDNAINRVIVMLRKALGDENLPREYIATVPKVGYRFIGQPKPIAPQDQQVRAGRKRSWLLPLTTLIALTALVAVLNANRPPTQSSPASVHPVSREPGWQFDADLSPDEQLLLFSVSEDTGNVLYLQDLSFGGLTQVSDSDGDARGGRWSHDGEYFVYLYYQGEQCSFRKVNVDESGAVVSNELLQSCSLNSDTTFALSLDDEILYFVERPNSFSPYVAYALDMQEQQRWRLAQPLATSYGNHYLDVHPVTGKVLLLSEPKPGKSALYEIDVPGNEYKRIQAFDYDLYSAVWGHQPNTVVHPAEHPSYQLLKTNTNTGVSHVLVSDSRRISTPRRINNSQDYLFASYLYNRDVNIEGYEGPDFNSAVMDYLPEFSNSANHLAFVSKRSGFSEVLILDLTTHQLTTLKDDDRGITYYNLAWSSDDRKLAANTSKGIVIYDIEQRTQKMLPIDQLTYEVNWYSESELSFSQYIDGGWQAFVYNIDEGKKARLPEGVIFALTDADKHLNVYSGRATASDSSGQTVSYDLSACGVRYIARFQSNLKFENDRVFCPNPENDNELLVIDKGENALIFSTAFNDAEFYSVSNNRLATTTVATASSDVMRTRK